MRIIYFDLCAVVVYLIIIWTCFSRRLTSGRGNRFFLLMSGLSLVCSILDIAMEFTVNPVPLSPFSRTCGMLISFSYLVLRHGTLLVYFLLLFVITRTEYRLRSKAVLAVVWLPYIALLLLLVQNFFTQNVFSVTLEAGYSRESLMPALYGIAAIYWLTGMGYCLYCRSFLPFNKWFSLLSVYLLTFAAVGVQFIWPDLLVEMFSTAAGLLMILLQVMRPEESMDPILGVQSYNAYQEDLGNLLKTRQKVGIITAQMVNASAMRNYLGDDRYDELVRRWLEDFRSRVPQSAVSRLDIYFERPGIIYIILENTNGRGKEIYEQLMQFFEQTASSMSEAGIRILLKVCLILCPEDLVRLPDILNLGHRFALLGPKDQLVFRAQDLVSRRDFKTVIHTEEVLERAVTGQSLKIYYQPIYDTRTGTFHSAEALARLIDPQYGLVSPAVFIPAAERSGLIVPLGEKIIESVFRFLAAHDPASLGLDCIEINLSVAQCMDRELSDKVFRLQEQYGIDPRLIHFELTETTFDQISDIGQDTLKRLADAGYEFALDDYGTGYSNIQRLSRLEFGLIKIDKTLVDDLETKHGSLIMRNTVQMMHDLQKHVVIEGVETKTALETLTAMSGDYIQGFYFSKPLPEEDFLQFLQSVRKEG